MVNPTVNSRNLLTRIFHCSNPPDCSKALVLIKHSVVCRRNLLTRISYCSDNSKGGSSFGRNVLTRFAHIIQNP